MPDENIGLRNLRPASQMPGQADASPDFRRSLAVVIGMDTYSYGIPRPITAVNVATRLGKTIRGNCP